MASLRDTSRAMSQENVAVLRRGAAVFGSGNLDRYCSEFLDPDVEWHTASEDPDAGTHRGQAAFKRYVERWMESFDGLSADAEEYIAAGDRVFTWVRWSGRGRTSGIDTEWHLAIVYTMRDGKVVRGDEYFDRADALAVAGLAE